MHVEIPWVPWRTQTLVGTPPTHRELDGVRFTQHDHAGTDHAFHQRCGHGRTAIEPSCGAAGSNPALNINDVFHRYRDPVQWTDSVAGRDGPIGRLRCGQSVGGINLHVRVQLLLVPRDARQISFRELGRAQLAAGNLHRNLMYGRIGERH